MKAGFSIIERQKCWFGLTLNYIVVFNWQGANEIDMIGTDYLETAYIPDEHTVAIFKIKWK